MSGYLNDAADIPFAFFGLVSSALLLAIGGILLYQGSPAVTEVGWDLFSMHWNPARGQYGILPMLYGTGVVAILATGISAPVGLGTAVLLSEVMSSRWRVFFKSVLEILAGIPSIVYGLIGVATLGIWVRDLFSLQSGRTIFTASLLLSVMVLPIIITLIDDVLQSIPDELRESARGLGLNRCEVVTNALLPMAASEIAGSILLGFGRAMGETMAVMLVIGSIDNIPDPIYNLFQPGQTITSKLGREMGGAAFGSLHFAVMMFMGFLLILLVTLLTLVFQQVFEKKHFV